MRSAFLSAIVLVAIPLGVVFPNAIPGLVYWICPDTNGPVPNIAVDETVRLIPETVPRFSDAGGVQGAQQSDDSIEHPLDRWPLGTYVPLETRDAQRSGAPPFSRASKALRDEIERHSTEPAFAYLGRVIPPDRPKIAIVCTNEINSFPNRDRLCTSVNEYDAAVAVWNKVGHQNSECLDRNSYSGWAIIAKAEREQALLDYGRVLNARMSDQWYCREMAWFYATCPNHRFRDIRRAMAFATQACNLLDWCDLGSIDALAAACAASGDFKLAVKCAELLVEIATETARQPQFQICSYGRGPVKPADAKKRLALYKNGRTYDEIDKSAIAASPTR